MARLFKPRLFKPQEGKRPSAESTPAELTITDLSHDGRGVARHEGKTVFVSGALPSEQVQVVHYRRQKRFSECETKFIVQRSADRVEPECPHYQQCGGCQLQHLGAVQLHYKQQSLLSLLRRQQNLEPQHMLPPIQSSAYGYRARVRLGVDSDQQLAFRQQGSDRLVPVQQCLVLRPQLAALIPQLQTWLNGLPAKAGVSHIELVAAMTQDGQPASGAVIRHLKPLMEAEKRAVTQIAGLAGCWFQAEKQGVLRDAQGADVDPRLYLHLDLPAPTADRAAKPVVLGFHPQDFTQVNAQVNVEMVAQALAWLELTPADRVADLFCGIGNFTVPLAQRAGKVLGIEGVDSMVVRGHENRLLNNLTNCTFQALNLDGVNRDSQALTTVLRTANISKVLLDPPRTGAKFVCEQMAAAEVERLVYVSCNPASFARDAAILVEAGYTLAEMRGLDMFPQTIHMETMALFVRGQ